MGYRMTYSRLLGALFIAGFVTYGVGFGLTSSVLGAPDFLSTISAHQTTLVLGAFLMLLTAPVDVGKAVLFFPILENHGKRTALAYLAAMIVEVVLLSLGALCLLMLVPLGQSAVGAGVAKALGSLLTESNTMAYQISQMSLGIGAVFLCSLLFRTRLIPRWLAGWGVIGYALHVAGAIADRASGRRDAEGPHRGRPWRSPRWDTLVILEEAPLGPEREVPGAEKLKDMLGGARPDLVKDPVPYLKERWEEPGTIAT